MMRIYRARMRPPKKVKEPIKGGGRPKYIMIRADDNNTQRTRPPRQADTTTLKKEYKDLAQRLERTPSLSDIKRHAHELTYGPSAYQSYPITKLAREVGLRPNQGNTRQALPPGWQERVGGGTE